MAENAFAALRIRLEAAAAGEAPPSIDPRAAALAALMVSDFVAREPVQARFDRLAAAGELDAASAADLALCAKGILFVLARLGKEGGTPPTAVVTRARELQQRMASVLEANLDDIGDAQAVVDYVRMGSGPTELAQNLRLLARFTRAFADHLTAGRDPLAREDEDAAIAAAAELEAAAGAADDDEKREWRAWLRRAWALFERSYDEVGRAGRFLFHREKPLFKFPPLLTVGTANRRLRRAEELTGPPPLPVLEPMRAPMASDEDVLDVGLEELVFEAEPANAPGNKKSVPPKKGKTMPPSAAAKSAKKKTIPPATPAKAPPAPKPPALPSANRPSATGLKAPGPASSAKVPVPKPLAPATRAPQDEVDVKWDTVFDEPPAGAPPGPPPLSRVAKPGAPPPPVRAKEPTPPAKEPTAVVAPRPGGADKRTSRRFPVSLKLTVGSDDEVGVGTTENLSEKGAFVATPSPRPGGTRLVLLVSHPDTDEVLHLDAVVRWGRPARRGVGLEAGMGLEFVDMTDAQRASLKRFLG